MPISTLGPNALASSSVTRPKIGYAGAVLQVVSTVYTGASGTTSSSVTATGRFVNITPTSSSSKIFVIISGTVYKEGGAGRFYMYRNGSTQLLLNQMGANLTFYTPAAFSYLDSPATTSSVRYEIYMSNDSGAQIYFPPGSGDVVTCTAMEIAG